MYSNNFAAAIRVNGKILKEFKGKVYVPFNSEYEIRLKNLSPSQRCGVSITIDGQSVTDGRVIVDIGQTLDLERFIKNHDYGNRFKFIERTSKIEDYRGIKIDDGLILIKYTFEKTPYRYQNLCNEIMLGDNPWDFPMRSMRTMSSSGGRYGSSSTTLNSVSASLHDGSATMDSNSLQNEAGITVGGSVSNQKFKTTHWYGDDVTEQLIIKLCGETEDNKRIREPINVRSNITCNICGTVNKVSHKYCSECGSALQLV
jgi:hypothetical protein